MVGAEWSDYDKNFSPTGALVGAVGTAAVLLGLGAFFDRRDRKRRQQDLPDEIRGVLDRLTDRAGLHTAPLERPQPRVEDAVDASIQRNRAAVDPERIRVFVQVMLRFSSLKDPIKTADLARTKLLMQHDPVIAAIKTQKEFLDVLLDSSRGDPSLMGTHIANSCFGICELVVEGKVSQSIGREYFDMYKKVFERVYGIKTPFQGGPFDFDTSLELAREALNRKGSPGGSGDHKEFERGMFAHFSNAMEQVECDRANGTLPAKTQQPKARMDPRAGLREALLDSYQPREMFGQECFFCGKTGSLMSPNLLEYYHDSKYKKNVGLVPTSEARGRVRGYMPICLSCSERCNKCGLPIRTKWVERMAEQVRVRAPHLSIVFGQGYCRHVHPLLNLSSDLKPLIRLRGTALAPEEYEESPAVQHAAPSESPLDSFIFAMTALGSPRDPHNLQKIGADAMTKHPDPYIAALEATKIIVDGVVLQSGTDHGLMARLMQNNCMGVVSLYLDGKVAETRAREYFRHFNELPRRALGLRPEVTARLPTFEQTIEIVRANREHG